MINKLSHFVPTIWNMNYVDNGTDVIIYVSCVIQTTSIRDFWNIHNHEEGIKFIHQPNYQIHYSYSGPTCLIHKWLMKDFKIFKEEQTHLMNKKSELKIIWYCWWYYVCSNWENFIQNLWPMKNTGNYWYGGIRSLHLLNKFFNNRLSCLILTCFSIYFISYEIHLTYNMTIHIRIVW